MRSVDDVHRLFAEMDRSFDEMRRALWSWETTPGFTTVTTPALEPGQTAIETTPTSTVGTDDPTVYLEEVNGEYVFAMDLPGFDREDIDCRFDGGVLSIHAHTDVEEGTDTLRAMRSRRVARQLPIPKAVIADEITATYRNGILEVHLPIVEDEREASGHRIDIE